MWQREPNIADLVTHEKEIEIRIERLENPGFNFNHNGVDESGEIAQLKKELWQVRKQINDLHSGRELS